MRANLQKGFFRIWLSLVLILNILAAVESYHKYRSYQKERMIILARINDALSAKNRLNEVPVANLQTLWNEENALEWLTIRDSQKEGAMEMTLEQRKAVALASARMRMANDTNKDVRSEYPQYNDFLNEDLANNLSEKFDKKSIIVKVTNGTHIGFPNTMTGEEIYQVLINNPVESGVRNINIWDIISNWIYIGILLPLILLLVAYWITWILKGFTAGK